MFGPICGAYLLALVYVVLNAEDINNQSLDAAKRWFIGIPSILIITLALESEILFQLPKDASPIINSGRKLILWLFLTFSILSLFKAISKSKHS